MRGCAPTLMAAAVASHVTLVVPNNVVFDGAEEAVSANFEAAIERLAHAGMRVRREAVPLLDDALSLTEQYGLLAGVEAWHVLRDILEGPDYKKMDIRIWHDLTLAKGLTADDVLSLHEGYERMRSAVGVLLGSDTLLAMPTTKNTAPPIADLEADWEEYSAQNWLALGNTNLGNILGVAALTLPSGTNANNMPTGFMVCAPGGQDERLLAQGLSVEAALNNEGK